MQSQSFVLDYSIPLSERVAYILQGHLDPYRFMVGDISVRVSFTDDAPDLQSRMSRWVCRKIGG